ncbi:MAG TPA: hypothetical protein VMV10_18555 [Pirellulales bacterium]|nr:hypothetical protein [Pirellulales bacterium]
MQCAEFESRLNDLLDERLRLDADFLLSEHARCCRECRNLAAAYEAVVVGLEQSRPPEPGVDLAARVLTDMAVASGSCLPRPAALTEGHSKRVLPGRQRLFDGRILHRRVSMLAALAAAMLLAVALRWAVGPIAMEPAGRNHDGLAPQKQPGEPLVVQHAMAPDTVARLSGRQPPILEEQATGSDSFRGLAAETSQSFAVAMQLFPGVGAAPQDAGEASANDPASDWVHGLSDGLKPVTRPTAGALNSFLQLLAAGEKGSRS